MRMYVKVVAILLISTTSLISQVPIHDVHWLIAGGFSTYERFDFNKSEMKPLMRFVKDGGTVDSIGFTIAQGNYLFSDKRGKPLLYNSGCNLIDLKGELIQGSELLKISKGEAYCFPEGSSRELSNAYKLVLCSSDIQFKNTILYFDSYKGDNWREFESSLNIASLTSDGGEMFIEESSIQKIFDFEGITIQFVEFIPSVVKGEWWVVQQTVHEDSINVLRVDIESLELVSAHKVPSTFIPHIPGATITGGDFRFSPDGKWLIAQSRYYGTYIWSFDRETGDMEHAYTIPLNEYMTKTQPAWPTAGFDPSSQYVYWNEGDRIFRYNLYADNFIRDRVLVHERPIPYDEPLNNYTHPEIGPDGVMYYISTSNSGRGYKYWSIDQSWEEDVSKIEFNYESYIDQSNGNIISLNYPFNKFPRYRVDYPWDTLINNSTAVDDRPGEEIAISYYPNPLSKGNMLVIDINHTCRDYTVRIVDQLGRTMMKEAAKNGKNQITLTELASGIYFIVISDCHNNRTTKKLMIL